MVPLRHIPGLFLATTFTFGGLWPLVNTASTQRAMKEYGLPLSVIRNEAAGHVFSIYSSRMTVIGLALYAFFYRQMYSSVDIVFVSLGWAGVVDGLICYRVGVTGTAWFRALAGAVVCGFGALGGTAGGEGV